MKITHIISSFKAGGAEVLLLDLCKHLNGKLDIAIITLRGGELEEEFKKINVPVTMIQRKGIDLKFIKRLRGYIKENNIDIIHTHQLIDALHAIIASRNYDIKIVLTVHSIGDSLIYKLQRLLVYRRLHSINYVSNTLLKDDKNSYKKIPKYVNIIYNGVNTTKLLPTESTIRSELGVQNKCLLLGMIGNFYNDARDQLTICKGLNIIFQKYEDVHFVFVGGKSEKRPEYFNKCYRYCKENKLLGRVHFLGLRRDVNNILQGLDIFVYSTNRETFGIAVVEAMMSGTPVIVNDLPVFKEITGNGKYALLYKTKDVDALVEKIEYLIEHPEKRKQLGERASAWAREQFSIEKHIEKLNKIYEELL